MFSLNWLNSVTKIFVITVNGFEHATSGVRDQECYHNTSKTQVTDKILKLTLIHASMIYQIL